VTTDKLVDELALGITDRALKDFEAGRPCRLCSSPEPANHKVTCPVMYAVAILSRVLVRSHDDFMRAYKVIADRRTAGTLPEETPPCAPMT
jgi:hypothetical protein